MKRLPMAAIGALAVAHALAANPSATVTALVQNGYGDIQVDYSLADGPAIVTVAFATNGAPVAPSATVSWSATPARMPESAAALSCRSISRMRQPGTDGNAKEKECQSR